MVNTLNMWRTLMNQYENKSWVVIHKGRNINVNKHEKGFTLAVNQDHANQNNEIIFFASQMGRD